MDPTPNARGEATFGSSAAINKFKYRRSQPERSSGATEGRKFAPEQSSESKDTAPPYTSHSFGAKRQICIYIDDHFTNESAVREVINLFSNDALVFIMEFGNFNLIYNQCLIKGLETFNFISDYPSQNPDLIVVFATSGTPSPPWTIESLISKRVTIINVYEADSRLRSAGVEADSRLRSTDVEADSRLQIEYICCQCNQKSIISDRLEIDHICQSTTATAEPTAEPTVTAEFTEGSIGRARSFQFIDENNSDIFLDKCCKTFISDDTPANQTGKRREDPVWDAAKNENSKFMQVMLIEIKRLGFREKKEEFKKQIKKSSSNPSTHPIETNFVRKKPPQMIEERQISKLPLATQSADKCKIDVLRMPKAREPELRCQASTKKNGTPCHNSALPGTNYCGISSHKKLAGK